MESLLPSEIARLVYGYLEAEKCSEAASQFLKTSQHLQECYQFYLQNGRFSTKVMGLTLLQCLDLLCSVYRIVQNHVSLLENDTVEKYSLPEQLEFLLATKNHKNEGDDDNVKNSNQVGKKTTEKEEDLYSLKTVPKSKGKVFPTSEKPLLSDSSTIFTPFLLSVDDDLDQVFPVPETTSLDSLPGTTKSRRKSPMKLKSEDFWTDNGSINGAPVDVALFQKPFLDKPELPTKIAETINKALKTPEKPRSKGKGRDKGKDKDKGKDRGKSAGEQLDSVIKTVVNQMVDKDPAFDDVLAEIIGKMDLPNNPPPLAPVKEPRKTKEVPKPDSVPVADYSNDDRLSTPDFEPSTQDTPTPLTNPCSSTISDPPNPATKSSELNFTDTNFTSVPAPTATDPAKPPEIQVTPTSITIPEPQVSTNQVLPPASEQILPSLQPEILQQPLESSSIIVVADSADAIESQSLVVQPQYFTFLPTSRGLYSNPAEISAPLGIQSQDYMQNIVIAKEQLLSESRIVTKQNSTTKFYVPSLQKRGEFINIAPKSEFIQSAAVMFQAPAKTKPKPKPPRNRTQKKKTEPTVKPQEPLVVEVRILDSVKDAAVTEEPSQDGGGVSAAESYRQLVEAMTFGGDKSREATPVKSAVDTVDNNDGATADEVEEVDEDTKIAYTLNSIVNIISSSIPGTSDEMSDQTVTPEKEENQRVTLQKLGDQEPEKRLHQISTCEKVSTPTVTDESVPNLTKIPEKMPDARRMTPERASDEGFSPEKSSNQISITEKMSCETAASEESNNPALSSIELSKNSSNTREKLSNALKRPEKRDTNQSVVPRTVQTNQIVPPNQLSEDWTVAPKETSKIQSISLEKVSTSQVVFLEKVPEIQTLLPDKPVNTLIEPENQSVKISEKSSSCEVPEETVCVNSGEVIVVESLTEEKSTVARDELSASNKDAGQFFSMLKLENKSNREQDSEKKAKNPSILDKSHLEASNVINKASIESKVACASFPFAEIGKATDSLRVFPAKCDSISPIRVPSNQRQSLSTPRRKKSHVRALDFSTPKNFKDQFKRKANTSPKALKSSGPLSDRVKSVRRSELFQSPTSPILNAATETTWHFESVSRTPNNEKKCSAGLKTPQESRVRSITSPLSSIKEELSPCEESTVDSLPERPPMPIATRPPVPKLSGGWDKVNGVGLIVGSPKYPTPRRSFDEDSNSLTCPKSPKVKVELTSWDSKLRAMLRSQEEDPESPKKNTSPKSVPKKSGNSELLNSTPKAKLTPKKRGKKLAEKKSPVKKKIRAVVHLKSKNKSPLKVDFAPEVSGTPTKIPAVSIFSMPEFTPNKAENTKISPRKVETVGTIQKPTGTSESDESVIECAGVKRKRKKPRSSKTVLGPTRTSRRIETRKKNKEASEEVVTPPKKIRELKCAVSPMKNMKEPARQGASPSKETKGTPRKVVSPTKETKEPMNEVVPPLKETEESLKQVGSRLKKTKESTRKVVPPTEEHVEQITSLTEETKKPVTEIVSPLQEVKELGKEGKLKKLSRGRRRKNPLPSSPDITEETNDLHPKTPEKTEDSMVQRHCEVQLLKLKSEDTKPLSTENPESLEQVGKSMVLMKKDESGNCPVEISSTFSPHRKDDDIVVENKGSAQDEEQSMTENLPKKCRISRLRKIDEQIPKEDGRSKNRRKLPSPCKPKNNTKRGRGRPKKVCSPPVVFKEDANLPCITLQNVENATNEEIASSVISPDQPAKVKRGRKAVPKKVQAIQESTDDEIGMVVLDNRKFIYTVAEIHAEGSVSGVTVHSEETNLMSNMSETCHSAERDSESQTFSPSEKSLENVHASESQSSTVDKSEVEIPDFQSITPEKLTPDFVADDKRIGTEKSETSITCDEEFSETMLDQESKSVETSVQVRSINENSHPPVPEINPDNNFADKSESEIVSHGSCRNLAENFEAEIILNERKNISEKSEADHQSNVHENCRVKNMSGHRRQNSAEKSDAKIKPEQQSNLVTKSGSEIMASHQSEKCEVEISFECPKIPAKSKAEIISDHQRVTTKKSDAHSTKCERKIIENKAGMPNRKNIKLQNVVDPAEIIPENRELVTTSVLNQFIESSDTASKAATSVGIVRSPRKAQKPSKFPVAIRSQARSQIESHGERDYQPFSMTNYSEEILDLRVPENIKLTEIGARDQQNAFISLVGYEKDTSSCDSSEKVVIYAATPEPKNFDPLSNERASSFTFAQVNSDCKPSNLSDSQKTNMNSLVLPKSWEISHQEPISKELSLKNAACGKLEETSHLGESSPQILDKSQSDETETIKNNVSGNIICTSNQLLHSMIHTSHDESSQAKTSEVDHETNEEFLRKFRFCVEYELDNGGVSYASAAVSDLFFLLNIPSKNSDAALEAPVEVRKAGKIEEINVETNNSPETSVLSQQDISAAESSLFDDAILTGRLEPAENSVSSLSQSGVNLEAPRNSVVERILAEISASTGKSAGSKVGQKRIVPLNKMSTMSPRNQVSGSSRQCKEDTRSISPFPLAKSPVMSEVGKQPVRSKVSAKFSSKPRLGQNFKSPSDTRVSFGTGSKRYDGRLTSNADFESLSSKGKQGVATEPRCSRKEVFAVNQSPPKPVAKGSIKLSPQKKFVEDSFKRSPHKRFSEGSTSQLSPQKRLTGGSVLKRSPEKVATEYRERNPPPRSPSPEPQHLKEENRRRSREKRGPFDRSPLPGARYLRDNQEHRKRSLSPEARHSRDKMRPLSRERRDGFRKSPSPDIAPLRDEKVVKHSWDKNRREHGISSSPEVKHPLRRTQVPNQERRQVSRQSLSPEARCSREKNKKRSGERQDFSHGSLSSGDRRSRDTVRPYSGDRRDPTRRSVSLEPRLSHRVQRNRRDHYPSSRHKPQNWSQKGKVYRRLPSPEDRFPRDANQRGREGPRYSNAYSSNRHGRQDTRARFNRADNSHRKFNIERNEPEDRPQINRKRRKGNFRTSDERTSRSPSPSSLPHSSSSMTEEDKCTLKRLGLWNKFLKFHKDKYVRREDEHEEESVEPSVKRLDGKTRVLPRNSETEDGEVSSENSSLNHGAEVDSRSTADDHDTEIKEILSKKRKIEDSSDENTSTSILDKRMKCGSIEALMNVNIPEFLSKIHPSEKE